MEIYIIGALIFIILVLLYTTWNLLRKTEKQEDIINQYNDYITEFNIQIKMSEDRLKQVDEKGMFKSDDEIGFFFKTVMTIQDLLNGFKIKDL